MAISPPPPGFYTTYLCVHQTLERTQQTHFPRGINGWFRRQLDSLSGGPLERRAPDGTPGQRVLGFAAIGARTDVDVDVDDNTRSHASSSSSGGGSSSIRLMEGV
ncbi:NUDIX hydrolase [Anopheles sinensis]|uniref:NUDIX hydrolase n=1 Tax=Anopheles sinensis TaxID=74873 RepID=A0A084WF19_ANOSI|nr:NUDIX hydrolase [Anopheles sinensis]